MNKENVIEKKVDEMAMENDDKITKETDLRILARPYHDIKTPFTVDDKGAFAEYILNEPELMPDLSLGATTIVQDFRLEQTLWLAARVVGLKAVSPFSPDRENMLYLDDVQRDPTKPLETVKGPHTHQPMIIRVQFDKELMYDNTSQERSYIQSAVQRPPSSSSMLFFPNILPLEGDNTPSLQDILDIRASGVPLGNIGFGIEPYQQNNDFLTYRWDVGSLDNKHIFIVGESGSGKTVLLKNLAYEFRRHNNNQRIVLTDVQGDIIQLLLSDFVEILQPKGWQRSVRIHNKKQDVEEAIKTLGPFQLVLPAARNNDQPDRIIALRDLARNRGIRVSEIGLRLQDLSDPSDVEYLFRVASEQVAMLLDEEAEALRRENQEVTITRLRNVIRQRLNVEGTQVESAGGTPYYKSTYNAALRALKQLRNYFDFHQPSMSVSNNPLDCFDFDGTTILLLESLGQDERVMWEMQLVNWLYGHKSDGWEAFVFFDEAHQIVPSKPPYGSSSMGTFYRLRTTFDKLSREGRKFGINLVLSTQSPKDLHEIVPDQCPTKIVMKINPRNAEYAFLEKKLALIANQFGAGQFWIQSPFNGTPNWVRIHTWAPPLPHERMTTFWEKVRNQARQEAQQQTP